MNTADTGDTAWVLASTALVMLQTPGLAFFYGGMVRAKNVLNVLMMSFICLGIVTVLWALYGFSLSFGRDAVHGFIGGFQYVGLNNTIHTLFINGNGSNGDNTIPTMSVAMFQLMFAVLTVALISGSVVERMRFSAWAAFVALWATFVYFPVAHWVFDANVYDDAHHLIAHGGWIHNWLGALDFAGGTTVHVNAGAAGLVLARVLGGRQDWRSKTVPPRRDHNLPHVLLGASLLWFGWYGFNAGSALGASDIAALAFTNTTLATATAVLAWILVERLAGHPSGVLSAGSAAVAGLVAITPACAYIQPLSAIVVGAAAGAICGLVVASGFTRSVLGVDDTLDVFSVHLVGGVVGTLLIGFFATKGVNPSGANGLFFGGGLAQLGKQAAAAASVMLYSAGVTFLIGWLLKWLFTRFGSGLRPTPEEENGPGGLDLSEHGESAYDIGAVPGTDEPVPPPAPVGGVLSTGPPDMPQASREPGRHRYPWRPMIAALLVVGLVVAAGLYRTQTTPPTSSRRPQPVMWSQDMAMPGSTAATPDVECVGVTDGSTSFGSVLPGVRNLLAGVHAEDDKAMQSGKSVATVIITVVLTGPNEQCGSSSASASPSQAPPAVPTCSGPSSPETYDAWQDPTNVGNGEMELLGALMELCSYDESNPATPVRLLVANPGQSAGLADKVAERITMSDTTGLLGITGIDQSQKQSLHAVQVFGDAHIPVVAGILKADEFTDPSGTADASSPKPYPYFFRVGPNVQELEAVLYQFVHNQPGVAVRSGLGIGNPLGRNSPCLVDAVGNPNDLYTQGELNDFGAQWSNGHGANPSAVPPTITFTTGKTAYQDMTANLGKCSDPRGTPPDVIFFGGRANDLPCLVGALQNENWGDIPIVSSTDLGVDAARSNSLPGAQSAALPSTDDCPEETPQEDIYLTDVGDTGNVLPNFSQWIPRLVGDLSQRGHFFNDRTEMQFDALGVLDASLAAIGASDPTVVQTGGQRLRDLTAAHLTGVCGSGALLGDTGLISFDRHGDSMGKLIVVRERDTDGNLSVSYTNGIVSLSELDEHLADPTYQGTFDSDCPATSLDPNAVPQQIP